MKVSDPVKYLEEKGVTVSHLSADSVQAFIRATKSVYNKWISKLGKDLYNTAKEDMAR